MIFTEQKHKPANNGGCDNNVAKQGFQNLNFSFSSISAPNKKSKRAIAKVIDITRKYNQTI